jgi:hypothetical protein
MPTPVARKKAPVLDEPALKPRKEGPSEGVLDREPDLEITLDTSGPHIRCPLCGWTPRKNSRWMCKCHHIWNTFDTGGVCPACLYQWKITQCLRCLGISAHSDWYAQ